MSFFEIVLIGVGLAMDAFAVSIGKGLEMEKMRHKDAFIIALFFGGFQALMPLIGWLLGSRFIKYIGAFDHWIAFLLLAAIGTKALIEAIRDDDTGAACRIDAENALDYRELLLLAVATSIDALAVGITLALIPNIGLAFSVSVIGIVTFIISYCGVAIGHAFGSRFKKQASIAGGVILILIGLRILLQGLGVI